MTVFVGASAKHLRHELDILLASTPSQTRLITGVDFDPKAFERVWKSEAADQRAASCEQLWMAGAGRGSLGRRI